MAATKARLLLADTTASRYPTQPRSVVYTAEDVYAAVDEAIAVRSGGRVKNVRGGMGNINNGSDSGSGVKIISAEGLQNAAAGDSTVAASATDDPDQPESFELFPLSDPPPLPLPLPLPRARPAFAAMEISVFAETEAETLSETLAVTEDEAVEALSAAPPDSSVTADALASAAVSQAFEAVIAEKGYSLSQLKDLARSTAFPDDLSAAVAKKAGISDIGVVVSVLDGVRGKVYAVTV